MNHTQPIQIVADLHTHTMVSTHAFSTLKEMTDRAHALQLRAMAVTEHAPAVSDAPHKWYFFNLLRMPSAIEKDFILLKGAEANVIDIDGNLDLNIDILKQLDWVIASIHRECMPKLSQDEVTKLWLGVAENPYVDMIGHCEEEYWKFDYARVIPQFAKHNKVVEINGNSPQVRGDCKENLQELLLCCQRFGAKIAVCSDAHSIYDFENYGWALDLLHELDFPAKLVVNSSMERLKQELALHGRAIANIL